LINNISWNYQHFRKKFELLFEPLYSRRKEVVIGASEPTEEEIKEASKLDVEKEDAEKKVPNEEKTGEDKKEESEKKEETKEEEEIDMKGVPSFWLYAFQHHGDFSDTITAQDEKAMKYIIDVRWKTLPIEKGKSEESFILEFEFSENPYFNNKILTKTYYLLAHEQLGETMFDKMEGTDIDWKPGKNLTMKLVQVQQNMGKRGGKKGRKGKSGPSKMVTVEEPCESFFNFFKSDIVAAYGFEDMDEVEDLQELYEADYEMGNCY